MILNSFYYKVSILLIYFDMISINVVVIVVGLSEKVDHTILYVVRCDVLIGPLGTVQSNIRGYINDP